MKITFMGAGSTVFARNIIGDCMCSEVLRDAEFALYDIDGKRLRESQEILSTMNRVMGGYGRITAYLGVENRREALRGASFVVNAIQVGGYDPCTITDFEIPKKYGLRQTIGDTLGIGGIMRALRTIPVMEDFARDMQEVCPDAWLLNYTNPMAMLMGYIQRYAFPRSVGLCHSVQSCAPHLLWEAGMDEYKNNHKAHIAGINHQAWLLDIRDKAGNDLYPTIKKNIQARMETDKDFSDQVRCIYMDRLGYYCTESSEHNAEYNPWFIKGRYPHLIARHNIPLDEYPRRCIEQIAGWKKELEGIQSGTMQPHVRTGEYGSYIMEAMVTGNPYQIGGNVLNTGHLIENFPEEACVEVPCLVNGTGIHPTYVGQLPTPCAALNMTNINCQLMTIEAARTRRKNDVYLAAMLDPHTGAELDIDTIVQMVDELLEAHEGWMPNYI